MDYVHAYDRKRNAEFLFRQKNPNLFFILVQSSLPLPTIHFLSLIDCSQTLAKVAQTVCQQVKQGEIISDSIQIDTIDRCYTSKRKKNFYYLNSFVIELSTIPEINLALIIGPIKSALGLHPWLIRLTEFM